MTGDFWNRPVGRSGYEESTPSGQQRAKRTQRDSVVQWCNEGPGNRGNLEPMRSQDNGSPSPVPDSPWGGRRPQRLRVHAVNEDEEALTGAVDGISSPRSPYQPPPRSPYGDGPRHDASPRPQFLVPQRDPFDDRAAIPSPQNSYVPPLRSPYDALRSPRAPPRPQRPRESQIDLPPWEPSVYPKLSPP